jgi:uncharacterized protein (TIGR03067 family)
MRYTLVGLSLLAVVSLTPAQEKDLAETDLTRLRGTWDVIEMEFDGNPAPKEKAPARLVFSGNKLTGLGPEMTIALDPGKKPKAIDLTFRKGDESYPVRAIYDLTGDELKLCIPLAPAKGQGKVFENRRPESFETQGKAVMLIRARRAAEKKPDPADGQD